MRTPAAPLLLGALALAACTPAPSYQDNAPVQQQLSLVASAETVTVEPARGGRALGTEEFARIRRFALETGNPYGTRMAVTPGLGMTDAALKQVVATLVAAGVPNRNISLAGAGRPTGGGVLLRRETVQVELPDCPAINRDTLLERENNIMNVNPSRAPSPRLGCSTSANLGLMLADPRELLEPNTSTGAPGYRGEATVGLYRTDRLPAIGGTTETLGAPAGGSTGQ